jgi:hypothetical protein
VLIATCAPHFEGTEYYSMTDTDEGPSRNRTDVRKHDALARWEAIDAQHWEDAVDGGKLRPFTAAERVLRYRLRKAGLLPSAESERPRLAEGREGPGVKSIAGCSHRHLRRLVGQAELDRYYNWHPEEIPEREQIRKFNKLFGKWVAFRNAWRNANHEHQQRLKYNFDLVGEILSTAKTRSPDSK